MKNKDDIIQLEVQHLVLQVVHAFLNQQNASGDTIKLSCSKNEEYSFQTAHESASTAKLPDSESINNEDNYNGHIFCSVMFVSFFYFCVLLSV